MTKETDLGFEKLSELLLEIDELTEEFDMNPDVEEDYVMAHWTAKGLF